ncbi:MAG: DNA adenine methylase [Candidatus Sumerlaeota bacterium]|nr:DNA adenine methylase [Candidatus Sumerlaeota bacterium]
MRESRFADLVVETSNTHPFSTLSPFRYPGGKSWLRAEIVRWISSLSPTHSLFVEPFAGGGSVGLAVAELGLVKRVLMVERDPDVAAVWRVILEGNAEALTRKIRDFSPSREAIIRALRRQPATDVQRAFQCLLRNRVHRGGVLAKGAGLLREGEDGRGVASRWYPRTLVNRIRKIRKLAARIQFLEDDGLRVIEQHSQKAETAFFVDPPYTAGDSGPGRRLYRYYDVDHEELLLLLGRAKGPCFVTYHNCQAIREAGQKHGFALRILKMKTAHHAIRRELALTR